MTVISGGAGEKDRTGITHESYLLMANSQSDMEEWVRAIRRVTWAPLGGGGNLKHIQIHKCLHKGHLLYKQIYCKTFKEGTYKSLSHIRQHSELIIYYHIY